MSTPYACMQLPIPANYRNVQGDCSQILFIRNGPGLMPNPVPPNIRKIQSDTNNKWYYLNGVDLGNGEGTLSCAQDEVTAGASPFVVLLNTDDGLHYKLQLTGVPPDVFWTIDETPVLTAVENYTVSDGLNIWQVTLVTDGGITPQLTLL